MIRKSIPVLLILVLTMMLPAVCLGEETPDYDAVIDKAFASGKLVLRETDVPGPDPERCTIIPVPGELALEGMDFPDESQIREALKTGQLFILAYSPDGKTAVGYVGLDSVPGQIPLIISGDQVRMIYPSLTHGAGSADSALSTYYSRFYYKSTAKRNFNKQLGIDYQGPVWSPDGRYYFAPNYRQSFERWESCHYIVDTQTAELIALDAFDGQGGNENYGILYAGCFSNDGQYFYGACRSKKYAEDSPNQIIRYDLNTFEAKKLADLENFAVSMVMLRNGEILVLDEHAAALDKQHIYRISPDGTVVTQPMPFHYETWRGRQIEYAPRSGWAVIWADSRLKYEFSTDFISGIGIQPVRPDDAEPLNLESALFIDNDTKELIDAPVLSRFFENSEDGDVRHLRKYNSFRFEILAMELSPGGRYAAVLAFRPYIDRFNTETELQLLIIRLEDHAYLAAEGLDIYEKKEYPQGKGFGVYHYASLDGNMLPVLSWTEAGLLTNCDKSQMWEIVE